MLDWSIAVTAEKTHSGEGDQAQRCRLRDGGDDAGVSGAGGAGGELAQEADVFRPAVEHSGRQRAEVAVVVVRGLRRVAGGGEIDAIFGIGEAGADDVVDPGAPG